MKNSIRKRNLYLFAAFVGIALGLLNQPSDSDAVATDLPGRYAPDQIIVAFTNKVWRNSVDHLPHGEKILKAWKDIAGGKFDKELSTGTWNNQLTGEQ